MTSANDHKQDAALPDGDPKLDPLPTNTGGVWLRLFAFLLGLEVVTGVLMMTVYSPSTTTAWASVWYIQTQMDFGWLIRGVHRFSSDAMLLVAVAYLLHLLVRKAYCSPRHAGWWIGLCLVGLVMAISLTGYLLPWDQRGYWGTMVRVNIASLAPAIGPWIRDAVLGGAEPGHLTLTRFYALHAVVLPALAAVLLRCRLQTSTRSEKAASVLAPLLDKEGQGEVLSRSNHPPQSPLGKWGSKDAIARLIALGVVAGAAWYAHAILGDPMLSAPADPSAADFPARPEWFNLFLFQWLKGFHGPTMEVIGAIAIPGAVTVVLLFLPFGSRVMRASVAHRIAWATCLLVSAGVVGLTFTAVLADRNPSDENVLAVRARLLTGATISERDQATLRSRAFHERRIRAAQTARRAMQLAASDGVPPSGPLTLLARDPLTRGPQLFAANCATCHRFDDHNGLGVVPADPPTASDLAGFASHDWIRSLLTNPMSDRHFGRMKKPDGEPAHTRMAKWIAGMQEDNTDDVARSTLDADFDAVSAYLEDESMHPGRLAEQNAETSTPAGGEREQRIHRGRAFFMSTCNECHRYDSEHFGTFRAPEMRGYGSVEWIAQMIAEPSHNLRYRSKGREPAQMPSFRDQLTESERFLIAEWINGSRDVPRLVVDKPESP